MAHPAIPPTLFVTRKWPPAVGGMETWSVHMARELALLGPVTVSALPGRRGGRPPAWWQLMLFPFTVLRDYLAMPTRPAVVHLGDMALWPLALLIGRRRRVVLSAHGTDVAYHRRGGIKGRLYGWYLRLGARTMRRVAVIANSSASAAVARETGWRTDAIVPLGTDLSAPHPACEAPIHDDAIVFAGRLVARKGCGWFVREVMPLLPQGMTLKIAGTPWDAGESWVLDHPLVEHLGPLPPEQLAQVYARALCVIVPNIEPANGEFEGFGLVACEAAACGGVVLAARTGGLVEGVRDGETGMLLPSGDAAAWAEAIGNVARWVEPERQTFCERARAAARVHYGWSRVARDTADVYGRMA